MGDGLFSSRDCVMLMFVYFRLFANRRGGVAIFRDKVFQMSSLFFGSDSWPEKKLRFFSLHIRKIPTGPCLQEIPVFIKKLTDIICDVNKVFSLTQNKNVKYDKYEKTH